MTESPGRVLDVDQEIEIAAPVDKVFAGLLARLTSNNVRPDGVPMPMVLEARPGGRWFRELEDDAGHLWGFVQVIKPPTLLEITGPMFMSYPVSGHVQFRLEATETGTRLSLRHRAFGLIEEEHTQGATAGWSSLLERVSGDLSG